MSTEINIRKRIDIQEEGVSITPDVSSINFTGAGVTASAVGQDVTVDITAAAGSVIYYMNQTVAQAPYQEFSSTGTTAVEQVVPATVAGGATATIAAFQTPLGVPNTTVIPQGLWQLFLHFNATTAGQNWVIRPFVYKRDLGGIETLIFTPDPEIVTSMSTTTTMYTCDGVIPNTTLLTTDRIVVKIDVQNTTGVSQTVNFRTEGSQHYSVAATTLNQIVPTGGVTSVTGTAPVVSSGGTTPAISMPQANGSTNGYLSSTDWSTFNGKQNAITLTTTGTSGAATLVGSTLNVPQYAGGLTYFTEAQNTAAPNATVPVDSLTAVSATTDADFAIVPKGNGAILADIPDNTTAGGNKRGTRAVDLQMERTNANQVASGGWSFVAGRNNRASTDYANALGAENIATGSLGSFACGYLSSATGSFSTAHGYLNTASGNDGSVAIGYQNTASGQSSVSLGNLNTASGGFSFAGGNGSSATGAYGFAFGYYTTAVGAYSYAIGRSASATNESYAFGWAVNASGQYSTALGASTVASGQHSTAMGLFSSTLGIYGRQTYASGVEAVVGDSQASKFVLRERTTNASATALTTNSSSPSTNNQIVLSNQSAYGFTGTIVGKQSGSTNAAMWKVEGLIARGANAASTVLTTSTVTLVSNAPGWGTPNLSADPFNGGLQIQVVGAVATNIQWTAVIDTTEVIYA